MLRDADYETHLFGFQHEIADVERELVERLARFQKETDDPILKGPIERPPTEAAKVQHVQERKLVRVRERDERYPREV